MIHQILISYGLIIFLYHKPLRKISAQRWEDVQPHQHFTPQVVACQKKPPPPLWLFPMRKACLDYHQYLILPHHSSSSKVSFTHP